MSPFDQSDFPLPRPIPEGHRRREELGFASPSVEAPVTDGVLRSLIEGRERVVHGWNKGRATPEKPYCAVHACMHGHHSAGMTATDYLDAHVPLGRGYDGDTIRFNDDPRTTHADVLSLFDRAIAARRSELAQAAVQAGEANPAALNPSDLTGL